MNTAFESTSVDKYRVSSEFQCYHRCLSTPLCYVTNFRFDNDPNKNDDYNCEVIKECCHEKLKRQPRQGWKSIQFEEVNRF